MSRSPRLLEVLALADVAQQWAAGAHPAVLHSGDCREVRDSLVDLGLLEPGAPDGTIRACPTPAGLALGLAAARDLDAGRPLPLGLPAETLRALAHLRRQELAGAAGGRREGSPCSRSPTSTEADWRLLEGHGLAIRAGKTAARTTATGRVLADAILPERPVPFNFEECVVLTTREVSPCSN